MRNYLTFLLFVVSSLSFAQFSDDFSDGDFTNAPAWVGMTANFEVDASDKLHLLAPAVDDTSYLSVATSNVVTTWDFYVRMEFNPSSSNLTRVYLMSDNADLTASLNGYFVMIGNTDDEISLYRQTGTTITEIIDGANGTVNSDPVNVRIRVSRDASGNWDLTRDATGGYSFTSEGTVNDNTYTSTSHFGVFCKYTSSRSELFYFDDLGDPYVDGIAPTIISVTPVSATQVDVLFSEPLNAISAETALNYSVDNGIGVPLTAGLDGTNFALVHLTTATSLVNGTSYNLTVNNVTDVNGNSISSPTIIPFLYFVPDVAIYNDVIITEIMVDPSPAVGLPEVEYIEIYNRSAKYFDLTGWTIADASSSSVVSTYVLAPGMYALICNTGDETLFLATNKTSVSLPSFNNDADAVVLKNDAGVMIDSLYFDLTWYHDNLKDEGGWSLERKHNDAPCSDENNWSASNDIAGGTPGTQNSVWTDQADITGPVVSDYEVISETEMQIYFNESLDTTISAILSLTPAISVLSWNYISLSALHVNANTLAVNVPYLLAVSGVTDCWGNTISATTIELGLPDSIESEDLILNEIMFNPLTNGSDYVEIYNRSEKILDLNDLMMANWDDDSIANYKDVINQQQLILPGEYILLTEDSTDIQHDFSIYGVGRFVIMDLPTYNDDSGSVYLLNSSFQVIDFFRYDEDMHYALITDEEGKSLERGTFDGGMNNAEIWHTAAENVAWGTPGYLNSQLLYPAVNGAVTLSPEIFSPDNDGYQDVLTIQLELETTDNIINIEIYDNRGRMIKELKDNFFAGNSALFTWDGSTEENTKAPIGTYVLLITITHADGSKSTYKEVCVVGGKL
ncbi:MAG: lamin tail domain-containing protein [Crocinitomicaceae bacterium]|nr:lamin tail domain-containing protein [Crocinitomicaceae bacterium]MBK8927490.1 lamin tail domain-containing protein [Crocinitomicaceae bacterium]